MPFTLKILSKLPYPTFTRAHTERQKWISTTICPWQTNSVDLSDFLQAMLKIATCQLLSGGLHFFYLGAFRGRAAICSFLHGKGTAHVCVGLINVATTPAFTKCHQKAQSAATRVSRAIYERGQKFHLHTFERLPIASSSMLLRKSLLYYRLNGPMFAAAK